MSDSDLVADISITRLLREWDCDPFTHQPWDVEPLTRDEVAGAIQAGLSYGHVPWSEGSTPIPLSEREHHLQRVGYFVVHGWTDPIWLDLGCPSFGLHVPWPIQDGNHRFAAALYRGDRVIRAEIAGEIKWIRRFVENPCRS